MNKQAELLSNNIRSRLTEIEEDYFLLLEANKRMESNGNKRTISFDSIMSYLGINEDELLDTKDAETILQRQESGSIC